MSTILSKPNTYNFAGNIEDLEIHSLTPVSFKLWRADKVVLDETYTPSANRVNISLKDYAEIAVKPAEVTSNICTDAALTPYYYEVDGVKSDAFYIVPGGVGAKAVDAALFLKTNFLTWQPQTRYTTTSAPQWLRYVAVVGGSLEVRGYFADGSASTVTHSPVVANCLYTFNVNYGYLISLFSAQPTYVDIWVKGAAGEALSYTQRYILTADDDPDSDYFVFANSLGGYDAVRFYGQAKDIAKPESKTVTSRGKSSEHNVETKQSRQKYTGFVAGDQYTPREQMRLWIMDFFGSSDKYVLEGGELKRIVVTGSKIEDVRGELSGYEFTYEIGDGSRYLNIPRAELPNKIEIVDPGGEVFFLKPRLENFPRANLDEEVFLPAQQAYGSKWSVLALSEVLAYLRQFVVEIGAGGGGGADIEALKKIFHPLGGDRDFDLLVKLLDAAAVRAKTVTAEEVQTPIIKTPNYSPGALGGGGALTENPHTKESTLEVHNVIAKNGITAPKLTVRKMEATGGITVNTAAYAELTRVENGGNYWKCFYKCEGQLWRPGDQPRIQDGFGGFFWGYITSVAAQPTEGEYSFNVSKTTLANGTNVEPKAGDVMVLFGHRGVDIARQSVTLSSCGYDNETEGGAPYSATYVGIDSFSISDANLKEWKGKRWSIKVDSFEILGPDGLYFPIARERGAWVESFTYYKNDRVSHLGSIWLCLAPEGTHVEPALGLESLWLCEVAKGDRGEGWRYPVQLFKWAENEPAKPVGPTAPGWCTNPMRARVLTNAAGKPLATADGKLMTAAYPANYRLWGCQGIYDGATETMIGDWGSVYPISGENGKDVDPKVLQDILDAQTEQNNRLASWASDAVISPTEKLGLRDQHTAAIAAKKVIDADAARYGLTASATYQAYVTKSGQAFAAWNKYSSATPENIPIEADYANIAAFNTATADIQIAIAAAAKNNSEAPIGAKNLYLNSSFERGLEYIFGYNMPAPTVRTTMYNEAFPLNGNYLLGCDWGIDQDSYVLIRPSEKAAKVKPNTTYTLSWWQWDGGWIRGLPCYLYINDVPNWIGYLPAVYGWHKHTHTFTTSSDSNRVFLRVGCDASSTAWTAIDCIMLTEGKRQVADWSPAPEDTLNYVDTKAAESIATLFGGGNNPELVAAIKAAASGDGAVFRVVDGAVVMSQAFVQKLVVGGLLTADNLVEFKKGLARIGMAELDSAGNMVVKDSGGVVRVRITNGPISSYVEGGSGSVPSFSGGAGASGLYDIGSTMTITTVGGDISITGTFEATATVPNADTGGASVDAILWLYRGSTRVAEVARINARAGGRNIDGTPRLYDRQQVRITFRGFCAQGTYQLKIEQDRGGFGYGYDGSSMASISAFSWDYSPTTGATTLGSNGYGSIWNKDNLEITEVINGLLHKTLKAEVVDMPGVLGKALVNATGYISRKWGKYEITKVENINTGGANKRVWHTKINREYSAMCNGYGGGSQPDIKNETPDYVDLYATGSFNIMLIGDNR